MRAGAGGLRGKGRSRGRASFFGRRRSRGHGRLHQMRAPAQAKGCLPPSSSVVGFCLWSALRRKAPSVGTRHQRGRFSSQSELPCFAEGWPGVAGLRFVSGEAAGLRRRAVCRRSPPAFCCFFSAAWRDCRPIPSFSGMLAFLKNVFSKQCLAKWRARESFSWDMKKILARFRSSCLSRSDSQVEWPRLVSGLRSGCLSRSNSQVDQAPGRLDLRPV